MANNQGTIELIAKELEVVLHPIYEKIEDDQFIELLEQFGIKFPPSLAGNDSVTDALSAVVTSVSNIVDLTEQLEQAITDEDIEKAIQEALEIIGQFKILIENVDTLANESQNAASTFGTVSNADINAFFAELPEKLLEYTFLRYLETEHPIAQALMEFGGIVERVPKQVGSTDENKPQFIERKLNLDNIPALLNDPGQLFTDLYGWGGNSLDVDLLLKRLANLLGKFDIPIYFQPPGAGQPNKVLLLGPVRIIPRLDINPNCLEIEISEEIDASDSINIPVNLTDWTITTFMEGKLQAGIELLVKPPATFEFSPLSGEQGFNTKLDFIGKKEDSSPFLLLGQAGGSRLQAQEIRFSTGANLIYSSSTSEASGSGFVEAEMKDGKLIIGLSESDGFISSVLSGINLESDFSFTVGVDSESGFYFVGSSSLVIQLPVHIDLSVAEVNGINLQLHPQNDSIEINLGTNLKFNLGPLKASVEDIGMSSDFEFVSNQSGNLGPVDFGIGFNPPNGIGLSVDAGAVKGGGYLYFDFEREEYAGALELVFSEWIALKAIGLITTKMPDGSKGFSMLIIITVEFGTGIQLGFGFTLLGVGGLLGMNRIVNIEPLKDGIRTGAVESVMFPQDVVANAPRIISDLRKFFPPREDTFLIGPMAKIGWGTPSLISVSIGIIMEIPSVDITILGVVKVVLPDEEADVLRLQVNFIGRIEPSNERLWFYAELFDSRVLFITLEGGMGLLVNWGDNANFVVSVGGFHPRYSPPPLPFPEPPRIAVAILNESYAKVRIEAYFAVTSNSVQFGAKAELFFGLSEFKIEGFLAFDALFQFDPFFFSFALSVSLSVKVFGVGLFSVGFSGILEGPTPWYIEGKGKISLLFFKIKVPFSHTWGEEENTKLDPIKVFPLIEKELNALTNWEARLPESSNILVSLRKLGESDEDQLVLHPVGTLRISQRKLPLNFNMDKVGNQRPSDVNEVNVEAAINGGGSLDVSEMEEKFAIGQFKDLDDSKRMSSPAFEPLDSGVEVAVEGEQLKTSQAVKRVIRYESIIIDNHYKRFVKPFFEFFTEGFTVLYEFMHEHFLGGNAVTKSELSYHHKKRMQPFDEVIQVKPNEYSVAFTTDNQPVDGTATTFTSQAKATQFMEQKIQDDPKLAEELHVIPNTEINTAA